MLIGVPDLVTNSYFPALAAEELGLYRAEGVDAHVDLLTPATKASVIFQPPLWIRCHSTRILLPSLRVISLNTIVSSPCGWALSAWNFSPAYWAKRPA